MAKSTDAVAQLKQLISDLASQRREHVAAIAEIDQTFEQLGISDAETIAPRRGRKPGSTGAKRGPKPGSKRGPKPGAKRGPKPGSTGKKRGPKPGSRRRGKFTVSGEQSVLDFVKSHGKPNAKEVNEHWTKEGRAGKADNALSKLVKLGSIKRVDVEGERGGRYQIA